MTSNPDEDERFDTESTDDTVERSGSPKHAQRTFEAEEEALESAEALQARRHHERSQVGASRNGMIDDDSDDGILPGSFNGFPKRGARIVSGDDDPVEQLAAKPSPPSTPDASRSESRASAYSAGSPLSKPFDQRFRASKPSIQLGPSAASSLGFLKLHSRASSYSSQIDAHSIIEEEGAVEKPWEIVKWSQLRKITSQLFSESGRRAFGSATRLTIGALVAVGTSRGIVLVFDYQQNLKAILGQGSAAVECGAITALAISADHTSIASGHADGSIFAWDILHPNNPLLNIPPLRHNELENRSNDVHVRGHSVIHVDFLGSRRTALVSADESGMAFSHLATRGLGALGRTVKSSRILGRYPSPPENGQSRVKPSTVLAFASLPLGNVEQQTDRMGLTALLTPYLLVIVSTTPIAQTQFKSSRASSIAAHSAMTGCLAWFPSVRLKNTKSSTQGGVSTTKLVFCWSNLLQVLELEVDGDESVQEVKTTVLNFNIRNHLQTDETIVAVQWMSRSVMAVLTITQKLLVVEDYSMRITDVCDLNTKHIYHTDLFAARLQSLVEKYEPDDTSMHGVIPDAFYMSLKAYKGRLFLLGANEVIMGTLSNWADRIVAYMENGNLVEAIELATSYYNGNADKITVGLPEDDDIRHARVHEKLLPLIIACFRYLFKADENDQLQKDIRQTLQELIEPVFVACLSIDEIDFLFEEVYEWYSDASCQDIFFYSLEPRITAETITKVPADVLKELISWYGSYGFTERLEAMICSLSISSMDIDQVTSLCKTYKLYDGLIYMSTQALGDYVSPIIDLLTMTNNDADDNIQSHNENDPAHRMFPYMAYTLSGRMYPDGTELSDDDAIQAKTSLYEFIFSDDIIKWPPGSGPKIRLGYPPFQEPSFPYLRSILAFDTANFMSMMNEAFEDSYLEDDSERFAAEDDPLLTSTSPFNRQRVLGILMQVLAQPAFTKEQTIFLDIFVARNLPKYPQSILLRDPDIRNVLANLCRDCHEEIFEECELSVEYLLSVYHPPDLQNFIPLFTQANFHRILKTTYKSLKDYSNWVQAYFDDEERIEDVYDSISECLRSESGLSSRQIRDVKGVVLSNALPFANANPQKAAVTSQTYLPELVVALLDALDNEARIQFQFLQALLESESRRQSTRQILDDADMARFIQKYIELMCRYEPHRVAAFVAAMDTANLKLDQILPLLEATQTIDAAVLLMAKDGLISDAMNRLVTHLKTLQSAIKGLVNGSAVDIAQESLEEQISEVLADIERYQKVGVWLCISQSYGNADGSRKRSRSFRHGVEQSENSLQESEKLWLELLDSVVQLAQSVDDHANIEDESDNDIEQHASTTFRNLVQNTFTAFLSVTTSAAEANKGEVPMGLRGDEFVSKTPNVDFLAVFQCFLTRSSRSSPTLSDLRSVLRTIFSAYSFEESVLSLAGDLLDRDSFAQVREFDMKRRAGWCPRSMACEACRKKTWGPGAGVDVWEAWAAQKQDNAHSIHGNANESVSRVDDNDGSRGKGRETDKPKADVIDDATRQAHALVVFACRHAWHRQCLESVLSKPDRTKADRAETVGGAHFECPLCHHE